MDIQKDFSFVPIKSLYIQELMSHRISKVKRKNTRRGICHQFIELIECPIHSLRC